MWAHLVSSYMFAFWAYYCLWTEYANITKLRLKFMAAGAPQPQHFTVLTTEVGSEAIANMPQSCHVVFVQGYIFRLC